MFSSLLWFLVSVKGMMFYKTCSSLCRRKNALIMRRMWMLANYADLHHPILSDALTIWLSLLFFFRFRVFNLCYNGLSVSYLVLFYGCDMWSVLIHFHNCSFQAADLTKPLDKRLYKGTIPTCHDFNLLTRSSDSLELLIGFSAGQVQLLDPVKHEVNKLFNEEVSTLKVSVYPKFDHFSKKLFSLFQIDRIAIFHLKNPMKKDWS